MQVEEPNKRFGGFVTLATLVVVVVALRVAEDVLMPVALSVLLAFLPSPLVTRLTRLGPSNAIATIVAITFAFSVIGAVGWIVATQVVHVVDELPKYARTISEKISKLNWLHRGSSLSRTSGLVEKLQNELGSADPQQRPSSEKQRESARAPVPVAIAGEKTSPLHVLRTVAGPLLGPFGTAGIVIVFVVAMLFQRHDLRERCIKIVSAGRLNVAT